MKFNFFLESATDVKKYLFQQLVACCSERQRLSGDLTATSIQIALNEGKIEAIRATLLNMRASSTDLNDIEGSFGEVKFKKVSPVHTDNFDDHFDDTDIIDDIEFIQDRLSAEYTENGKMGAYGCTYG